MPTNNSEANLKKVLDQFTPDVLGIFWITNEKLSNELLGFEEFNYLFDGLISQYLYGQSAEDSHKIQGPSNVFFTKNFNQILFLTHLKMHSEMAGILDDQIALIQENKNVERKKILLFNLTQQDLKKDLQKRYSKFEFINLDLG